MSLAIAARPLVSLALPGQGGGHLTALIGIDEIWQFAVTPFIVPGLIKVGLAACRIPTTSGLSRGWTSRKGGCLAL